MGSGDWFKTIIRLKKVKRGRSKHNKRPSSDDKSNGCKRKHQSRKGANKLQSSALLLGVPIEFVAATQIQTAFRAYMARKALLCLKGLARLQNVTQGYYASKQAASTLTYLKIWSKIQAEIRARRICMVTEDRIRQRKQETKQKLEAKLHELEVEWCGGSETMEEILARIQQREEAAVKRERAMAYAFSHQWRANSNLNLGKASYDVEHDNWGWSWKERWIAARPWECRLAILSSPNNNQSHQGNRVGKIPVKAISSNEGANARVTDIETVKRSATEKAITPATKPKSASPPLKPAEVKTLAATSFPMSKGNRMLGKTIPGWP